MRPFPEPSPSTDDPRTPLERFRTKPRKPLSVTDLVSPAWCELQYSYNLSKFGRKPRTQAMKTGSKIHQALEDEVHITIPVATVSKEDRFGLKIWNAVQGLRCLRETGLTRELEIWGIVEGQVINGVIDELSFTCPDPDTEQKLELSRAQQSGGTLPPGQLSIEQAFVKAGDDRLDSSDASASAWLGAVERGRRVYIADVKTRGGRSLPTGASMRPTWMQLMLYRKLLGSLSLNTVDAETIFARYGLAPLESFSEAFILGGDALGNVDSDVDSDNPYSILQANDLVSHPNLLSLWSLMMSEYQQTVPTIGDILRAEFRYSKTGEVIGNKLKAYNADAIDAYIKREMEWWKGDREAEGVEIEEAFKCRMCDFAEECTWRKTKIEEATEKSRLRKGAMEKSAV
jgi:exonuclease V